MVVFEEYWLDDYLESLLNKPLEEEAVEYIYPIDDLAYWEDIENELLCKRNCGYS